ncbi:hypothetical protein AGMMS50293_29480 [Spirochaetia bacterium]|nr:hypothetical protein AGMMS50293_29480 [Spirochaetia bacterium]
MKLSFSKPWLIPRDIKRQARENVAQGKILNIMNDTVFKAVFTDDTEDSREALRLLLSSCTHREISRVQVMNSELLPDYLAGKSSRLDVHATFNDGDAANLEIQIDKSGDDLKARAAFYAARLLSAQAKKGETYGEIKRVYQIFFLNCVLFPQSDKLPRRYFMMEEDEHDKLNEVMEIIFYEMPKLEQKVQEYFAGEKELRRENLQREEKWCIYMKYRHEAKAQGLIAELCREEGIMQAERALTKVSRDYEKWARTLYREKAEMDYRSGMYTARKEGIAEGKVVGIAEGKVAGIAEGSAKGYEQASFEIARKMKARGRPLGEIIEDTGLAPEIVEKL